MSKKLTDSEVANLFSDLGKIVDDVFAEAEDILKLEVDLSKNGIENQNSSDFSDQFTLPEAELLEQELAANAVFSPSEVNTVGAKYSNVLTTLFGGPSVIPNIAVNSSTVFSDKINSAFDTGFSNCDTNVSALDTVQGIVGIQARKISNVFSSLKSTFGVAMGNDDTVGPALFVTAVKNYVLKSTAQNLLLTQIRDTVSEINADLEDLDEDDYSINHKLVISESIIELSLADNILRAQLDNVLRDFPINFNGYENARQHIDNVKDVLCGINLEDIFGGYLSLGILKITGRLIYLEELLGLLLELEEELEQIYVNLGSFNTAFEDVTFFDSLLIPVIQLLRCRLTIVMADMRQAIDKNQLATFVLKEKEWCFELAILSSLMNASKMFDIDKTEGPLSVEGLDGVMDALFKTVNDRGDIVSISSIEQTLNAYIRNVRHKLSYNVPVTQIQARGNLVNSLINTRISENEKFALLLNRETLSVEGTLLSGLTIVSQFLDSVRAIDAFGTTADELETGNLKGLLNGDLLADSLKTVYETTLSEVSERLKDAGCRLTDVADKSLAAYDIFEDVTRSEALFNDSLAGFPEAHITQVVTGELPKYR